MFMRYYPKQIKPIPRLQITPKDRGKRHYWSCQRRDYGFYQSPQNNQYGGKDVQRDWQSKHERGHSTDINNILAYDRIKQGQDNARINRTDRMIENIKRKKKLRITRPIQLHLPSVAKLTKETQTISDEDNPEMCNSMREQGVREKKNVKQEVGNNHNSQLKKMSKTKRYMTIGWQNISINNPLNPSFVCSVQNPLPTNIVAPHVYRTLTYSQHRVSPKLV